MHLYMSPVHRYKKFLDLWLRGELPEIYANGQMYEIILSLPPSILSLAMGRTENWSTSSPTAIAVEKNKIILSSMLKNNN